MSQPAPTPSAAHGRLCIVLAAVFWSLSGLFARLLQVPTPLGLHEPSLSPLQMAFFRALFAGLFLLPMVRPRDAVSYTHLTLPTILLV